MNGYNPLPTAWAADKSFLMKAVLSYLMSVIFEASKANSHDSTYFSTAYSTLFLTSLGCAVAIILIHVRKRFIQRNKASAI